VSLNFTPMMLRPSPGYRRDFLTPSFFWRARATRRHTKSDGDDDPGVVSPNLEAIVEIRMRGPAGSIDVTAAIDTGFNGSLAIPFSIIQKLGLSQASAVEARLADGSSIRYGVYLVAIEWDGIPRIVAASAMGDECLLGMALLHGCDLYIKVEDGGKVEVITA